jgi:hypothetical protein
MWAAYCRLAYHGGIGTNNYMESLNRVIKHYLAQRLDTRMDSLLDMWVEELEPAYARKYMLDNARSARCVGVPTLAVHGLANLQMHTVRKAHFQYTNLLTR